LQEFIDPDQLSDRYGGNNTFRFEPEVWFEEQQQHVFDSDIESSKEEEEPLEPEEEQDEEEDEEQNQEDEDLLD
jgi:hypothetical protein